jgi:WYL_2, Sm-like SH3 beta-barrel fold
MTTEVGYNRETLLEMLRTREVCVTFKKQDGKLRRMRCTLNIERDDMVLPENKSGLITAWDLDAGGWRSFYAENVTEAL